MKIRRRRFIQEKKNESIESEGRERDWLLILARSNSSTITILAVVDETFWLSLSLEMKLL